MERVGMNNNRRLLGLIAAGLLMVAPVAAHAAGEAHFATPEAALASLQAALKAGDTAALERLFGSDHRDLVTTGEADTDAANYAQAAARLDTFAALDPVADDRRVVLVGADAWPFPIPLMRDKSGWFFDSAQGADELLNRRIGENEIHAMQVMAAFGPAERQYAAADHNSDGVTQYAQRLASTPGSHDGLYWPDSPGSAASPWGPLIAASDIDISKRSAGDPYHGYRFRILTRQGASAKGGAHDYVVNGRMIAGYALLGYPADYGDSGVMSFIVNQDGTIYEADLGADTAKIGAAMTAFDPGKGWVAVPYPDE